MSAIFSLENMKKQSEMMKQTFKIDLSDVDSSMVLEYRLTPEIVEGQRVRIAETNKKTMNEFKETLEKAGKKVKGISEAQLMALMFASLTDDQKQKKADQLNYQNGLNFLKTFEKFNYELFEDFFKINFGEDFYKMKMEEAVISIYLGFNNSVNDFLGDSKK